MNVFWSSYIMLVLRCLEMNSWSCHVLSSCPMPMNLRLHSMSSVPIDWCLSSHILSHWNHLPNFWSLLVGYHPCHAPPTSGMPIGFPQLRPERDFGCTPYHHTWVPLKSRRERFRGFYAIFIFGLIFWFSESENRIPIMWKSWHSTRERVSKKTRRLDSTIQSPLWSSRNGSGMTK